MSLPTALYLIPVMLAEDAMPATGLAPLVVERVREIRDFVAENAKSARRFLSACGHPGPIAALGMATLDEHTPVSEVAGLLAPLREGRPLGLLSEAGAPAVADPGANLVAAAHAAGFRVVPLPGPSAILLALMASGLEGQRFRFAGYLPAKGAERATAIRDLETRSASANETQVFIETPYRNDALLADLLAHCREDTRLAVAVDLTGSTENIRSDRIAAWRRDATPPGKRPAIFLLLAAPRGKAR